MVQLLDVRHDPTGDDHVMLDFLAELGVPVIVAVTKVDKLKPLQAAARVAELTTQLGLDPEQVIPFSARTGAGRDELGEAVEMLVTQPDWRTAP